MQRPNAVDHLDIPSSKKEIVKVLIESHTQKAAEFDDFVVGKGQGLIFALHGEYLRALCMDLTVNVNSPQALRV